MLKTEWKYYIDLYKKQYLKLILSIVISIAQTIFVLPVIFIVKYVIDELIPNENYILIIWMGLVLFFLNIVSYGFNLWASHLTLKTTKQVITDIRNQLLNKCFHLSRTFLTKTDLNTIHASIVQDTHRLDVMSNALISQFIPQAIIVFVLSLILLYLNWFLFLLMGIIIPLLYLLKRGLRNKQKERIKIYHRSFENFSKGVSHVLQKMELIKIQSAEKIEYNNQIELIDKVRTTSYSMAWLNTAYRVLQEGITAEAGILILVIGGISVGKEVMTLGALLSFFVAAARMSSSMQTVFATIPAVIEGNQSLITLYNFIRREDEIIYKGVEKIELNGNICLKSVVFSYEKKVILNNVDLVIRHEETTSLIGSNGVGKSTVLNLILGFYKPQKGSLFIKDCNYADINILELRKQIGVVMQNQLYFSGSIYDNLTYGTENVTKKEVIRACEMATAYQFIQEFQLGLNSLLGENGVLLSGGQKQKIGIARALLKKPKLLILDEPTNHLDFSSIKQLMENIKLLNFKPSILIITQNQQIARQADHVYELTDDGEIISIASSNKS